MSRKEFKAKFNAAQISPTKKKKTPSENNNSPNKNPPTTPPTKKRKNTNSSTPTKPLTPNQKQEAKMIEAGDKSGNKITPISERNPSEGMFLP